MSYGNSGEDLKCTAQICLKQCRSSIPGPTFGMVASGDDTQQIRKSRHASLYLLCLAPRTFQVKSTFFLVVECAAALSRAIDRSATWAHCVSAASTDQSFPGARSEHEAQTRERAESGASS